MSHHDINPNKAGLFMIKIYNTLIINSTEGILNTIEYLLFQI